VKNPKVGLIWDAFDSGAQITSSGSGFSLLLCALSFCIDPSHQQGLYHVVIKLLTQVQDYALSLPLASIQDSI
jgi:hypothetical protein